MKEAVKIYLETADLWNDQTAIDRTEELVDQLRELLPLKCRCGCAKSERES